MLCFKNASISTRLSQAVLNPIIFKSKLEKHFKLKVFSPYLKYYKTNYKHTENRNLD